MTIRADSGGIEVNLSPEAATAELTARGVLARGVLAVIQDVCEQRRRRARSLVRWAKVPASLFGILLVVIVFVALPLGISYLIAWARYLNGNGPVTLGWSTTNTLVLALDAVVLAALAGMIWFAGRPRTMITNALREERPTYLRRNKEPIQIGLLTGIVAAIVGSLIFAVGGYLLGKFG